MSIFCKLPEKLENEIVTSLKSVRKPEPTLLFLVFFDFWKATTWFKVVWKCTKNFYQDEDCFLVRGWSKQTPDIEKSLRNDHDTTPVKG